MIKLDDTKWLFDLKNKVPSFLERLKGKKRSGFYHYSLSGDYFGENIKWGLGNSVFFLKIIYTLGLENQYKREVNEAIKFIQSFQKANSIFSDNLVNILSIPMKLKNIIKTGDFSNIWNMQTKMAETRQSISTIKLFGIKPRYEYLDFPKTEDEIDKFLSELDWKAPWGAGSHFSHLLFFLYNSSLKNKEDLIDYSINWVNKLQNKDSGFWHRGNPSIKQKINGAMKIITALKVVDKVDFDYPEKIIDNVLSANSEEHACDHFNISYTLKYCNELTGGHYRFPEIEKFMYKKLMAYNEQYYPNIGGFSFKKNKANNLYYGAPISRERNEPDIHGTVMFLWGISVITQTLKLNLGFNEFIP